VCILISDLLNFNSTAEQVYENNHGMKAWQMSWFENRIDFFVDQNSQRFYSLKSNILGFYKNAVKYVQKASCYKSCHD
jgi:hypothetical protein